LGSLAQQIGFSKLSAASAMKLLKRRPHKATVVYGLQQFETRVTGWIFVETLSEITS
jgi:hypothetical protein